MIESLTRLTPRTRRSRSFAFGGGWVRRDLPDAGGLADGAGRRPRRPGLPRYSGRRADAPGQSSCSARCTDRSTRSGTNSRSLDDRNRSMFEAMSSSTRDGSYPASTSWARRPVAQTVKLVGSILATLTLAPANFTPSTRSHGMEAGMTTRLALAMRRNWSLPRRHDREEGAVRESRRRSYSG
jgi:hypothetical protein